VFQINLMRLDGTTIGTVLSSFIQGVSSGMKTEAMPRKIAVDPVHGWVL